jgi:hypothetical protein
LLPAGADGHHARADDQRAARRLTADPADERLHPGSRVSDARCQDRGQAELRHALFGDVARREQRADHRHGAADPGPLLSAAPDGHVDRRVRGDRRAHHRARTFRGGDARMAGHPARRCRAHRRADPLRVDHRPHPDQRRGRLRPRARDSGRLSAHAILAMGPRAAAARRTIQFRHRHAHPTAQWRRCRRQNSSAMRPS